MHTEINPHGHRNVQLKYYAVEWKYSYKCDDKNTSCTFLLLNPLVHMLRTHCESITITVI